eukprot:Plantae.Rhodophyta-Hildenbrandia_rubra.ctg4122.p1 GENE.Plantae.Rhodophyta-Hildenbrandia_rubra.ctg4122~~Plantae.Rhodophyta-Hildenbrandia_rubra.ctg4122.p1  ORF type:complete len:453 (-),score=48.21 Plantae.Rhodophyta-Hildenbrandia_rubra.ctg4122:3861-5219(-)
MSFWPTFVAVVKDGGNLIVPEYEFGIISPQMDSIEYRAKLCDRLGMAKSSTTAIVEFQTFSKNGSTAAELTIVELVSKECRVASPHVWVDWIKACNDFKKFCPVSAVPSFLRAFLAEKDTKTSRRRKKPWFGIGYHKKVAPTIARFVRAIDHQLTGAPEQLSLKEQATIFACDTDMGRLYLKVCPRDSDEIGCTQKVHEIFPEHVAKVVGVSVELHAILMSDFGQNLFELYFRKPHRTDHGRQNSSDVADAALKQWASLQQKSASRVKELAQAGLPIHDADWIRKGLKDVIEFVEENQCLSLELQVKLRGCSEFLESGFVLWENCSIPKTLVHGDFHILNVAQPRGLGTKFVFFDWASAFIGYPFLDLAGSECGYNPFLGAKSSYFENWANFADLETIKTLVLWSKPIELLRLAIVDVRYSASCDVEELGSKKFDIISSVEDMLNCLDAMHS